MVGLIGLVPSLCVELPFWNWYGYPMVYITSQAVVHIVGFLVGGLVIARLVKSAPAELTAGRAAA